MVKMRRPISRFKNNENVGSYKDITFTIISDSEMGAESIEFETKVHFIEHGKGKPILLVHGIGQSLYTWRNNINFLANNGYRVIAIDLPGFGYSEHPHIYYTVEEYALIIKAFLDAMKIKKTHIAAFSTGALSAVCFAAANPKRVDKLVMVSPGGPNEKYPFSIRFLTTWLGHTMFRLLFTESALHNVLSDMFFDKTAVTNEVVEEYYAPFSNKDVRDTLVMSMMHFDDEHARSLLRGIRKNTLVFSGTGDHFHDEKTIKSYAHTIPSAKHIRLRNCGHLVHEEKYDRFNNETLKFLNKQDNDEDKLFI